MVVLIVLQNAQIGGFCNTVAAKCCNLSSYLYYLSIYTSCS